jgi:hypothetical protein
MAGLVRRSLTAECPPIASTLASIANLLNDLVDVGAVPHVVSELTGAFPDILALSPGFLRETARHYS